MITIPAFEKGMYAKFTIVQRPSALSVIHPPIFIAGNTLVLKVEDIDDKHGVVHRTFSPLDGGRFPLIATRSGDAWEGLLTVYSPGRMNRLTDRPAHYFFSEVEIAGVDDVRSYIKARIAALAAKTAECLASERNYRTFLAALTSDPRANENSSG